MNGKKDVDSLFYTKEVIFSILITLNFNSIKKWDKINKNNHNNKNKIWKLENLYWKII